MSPPIHEIFCGPMEDSFRFDGADDISMSFDTSSEDCTMPQEHSVQHVQRNIPPCPPSRDSRFDCVCPDMGSPQMPSRKTAQQPQREGVQTTTPRAPRQGTLISCSSYVSTGNNKSRDSPPELPKRIAGISASRLSPPSYYPTMKKQQRQCNNNKDSAPRIKPRKHEGYRTDSLKLSDVFLSIASSSSSSSSIDQGHPETKPATPLVREGSAMDLYAVVSDVMDLLEIQ